MNFWQDGMVGPPLKMTQLRLWLAMTAICLGNEWQIVDNKTNFISLDIGKWLSVYITYIAL